MEAILRAAAVYFFLFFILRTTGKRSLGQVTMFDFVLILIVGEASQQALLGDDFSIMNCFIVVATLFGIDIVMSHVKSISPALERIFEDTPLILVENGKPLEDRMRHEDVDESEILSSARELQGLERMDQIKYAVLEKNGAISIIPKKES